MAPRILFKFVRIEFLMWKLILLVIRSVCPVCVPRSTLLGGQQQLFWLCTVIGHCALSSHTKHLDFTENLIY